MRLRETPVPWGDCERGGSAFERVHVHFWLSDLSSFKAGGGASLLPPARHTLRLHWQDRLRDWPSGFAPLPRENARRSATGEWDQEWQHLYLARTPRPLRNNRRGSKRAKVGRQRWPGMTKIFIPLSRRSEAEAGGERTALSMWHRHRSPEPRGTPQVRPTHFGGRTWPPPPPRLLLSSVPGRSRSLLGPGLFSPTPRPGKAEQRPHLPREPLREGSPLGSQRH